MRKLQTIFLAWLYCVSTQAQEVSKRPLTHEDYDSWKTLENIIFSSDGNWLAYELNPQQGDGNLVLFNVETKTQRVFARGYDAVFSKGSGFLAFKIKPPESMLRKAKVERKKREEMPKDSLAIFNLKSQDLELIPELIDFSVTDEPSDWMVYRFEVEEKKASKEEVKETQKVEENKENEVKKDTIPARGARAKRPQKEKVLGAYNPLTGHRELIEKVENYVISPTGKLVAAVVETKKNDSLKTNTVVAFDTSLLQRKTIDESREGDLIQLNVDFWGNQLAWLHSADTTSAKVYDLWLWADKDKQTRKAIGKSTVGMPVGHGPGEHSRPFFSKNGRRLFMGTSEIPANEPKDTLLGEEKYSLDIWHWNEPLIQPLQANRLRSQRNRTFTTVYHLREKKLVGLADETIPFVSFDHHGEGDVALGLSPTPYLKMTDYSAGSFNDIYQIDLRNGQRTLVAENIRSQVRISPGGRFITWFDPEGMSWMAHEPSTQQTRNITSIITVPLFDEENDQPAPPRPHGVAGWFENDSFVLINDKYDVWKVDPSGRKNPENITLGVGRKENITFRILSLDRETPFISGNETIYFSAFNNNNKKAGFYALTNSGFKTLIMADASFGNLIKAKDADKFAWRKGTFTHFNDIYTSGTNFQESYKVSNANPQQEEFLWGTVELVHWIDFENQPKQGLLYKPENLDPTKKYPMLVYFYDTSSNGLHGHSIPTPSRSTINRPYCTSNGYVVFIPDITYKVGFPGESAFNSVVSGTKAIVERYPFVDRNNIGLQGQSWGGYQIAYLVTRTKMFKAAMAGAPVSNMVSAYGGIRWESGRSRQFQYEETQSRIGGTLWEKPLRYIENSPVLFADKIETPLLIMHNDDDGAVPWYQGIELFMAMRRLNKPVWMLVYNNEKHNLTRWPNRKDLSIRMYQFFDHYLKGAPAPFWLKHGIPATQKGRTHGYELIINK